VRRHVDTVNAFVALLFDKRLFPIKALHAKKGKLLHGSISNLGELVLSPAGKGNFKEPLTEQFAVFS
jgi:hypothetical protein